MNLLKWFDQAPRRILAMIALACVALLAFGAFLQHVVGLEPCPMCIVQRYAMILVMIAAAIGSAFKGRMVHIVSGVFVVLSAAFGAFVAARQTWLQWYPPEVATCGRDFYGMIENFPLRRAIPMIFKGSGDCTKVDWTFLGGSIANWSFLWFCFFVVVGIALIAWQARNPRLRAP